MEPGITLEASEQPDRTPLYIQIFKGCLQDPATLAASISRLRLRRYQVEVAQAVIESVMRGYGDSIVVVYPRQSGKNELQAHIEAYLLIMRASEHAEMVKISPTWKPQSLNAMRRLERVLSRVLVPAGLWSKEAGYLYRFGQASIVFLSGGPETHIVGATANTLLEVDEAQDVQIGKYDKEIAPMAASTNATRVFWGTAWTSRTLLARELRSARQAQQADGRRRVFWIGADEVAREVPAYGRFVQAQVERLGRGHPLVKTQYFSEEIDADSGMFTPERLALMQGEHPRQRQPNPGETYALLLDVAGEDEAAAGEAIPELGHSLRNPGRDATALSVVMVDLSGMDELLLQRPRYRVVDRHGWVGVRHTELYGRILALAERWSARYLVVDATGVGAGLASFLERALPGRVIAFEFNQASKSKLGWDFLSVIETGRFKDWRAAPGEDREQREFIRQCQNCQMEALDGPSRQIRWGVPDGRRDAESGELVHDDWIISAALCAALDYRPWGQAHSVQVRAADPLAGMSEVF